MDCSRSIDLACRDSQTPVSAREIADTQSIPSKFLEQLFVPLRRAGLVTAIRGAHGGFVLSRDPKTITVLDVVEALEGPLASTVCDGERSATCGKSDACAAASVWARATDAVRAVFESSTIADLATEQDLLDDTPESSPAATGL